MELKAFGEAALIWGRMRTDAVCVLLTGRYLELPSKTYGQWWDLFFFCNITLYIDPETV